MKKEKCVCDYCGQEIKNSETMISGFYYGDRESEQIFLHDSV